MEAVNEWVDFSPDRSQLARVSKRAAAAPPAWILIGAVATVLGLSLSLALPPAASVSNGSVHLDRSNAPIDRPAHAQR